MGRLKTSVSSQVQCNQGQRLLFFHISQYHYISKYQNFCLIHQAQEVNLVLWSPLTLHLSFYLLYGPCFQTTDLEAGKTLLIFKKILHFIKISIKKQLMF